MNTVENDIRSMKNQQVQIIGEETVSRYAVAIILDGDREEEEILFEVRSERISHQPGDVCLPGGRIEEDEEPEETVIREVCEELLISPEQIQIICPVSVLINSSQQIHVYLCHLQDYNNTFSENEVARVFRVPLSYFYNNQPEIHEVLWSPEFDDDFPFDKIHGGRKYPWRQRKSRIRFYEYEGNVIWGITARIMEDFSLRYPL